jgi:hypothetical protein
MQVSFVSSTLMISSSQGVLANEIQSLDDGRPTEIASKLASEIDSELAESSTEKVNSTISNTDIAAVPESNMASASEPDNSIHRVDSLSNEIIHKEIELLRLNTNFRMQNTATSRLKPWRQFAYAMAGNCTSEAGISHIAYARWRYWRRPAQASKPFLRTGPICLIVGHSFLAGGSLIEGTLDLIADGKIKKKGFDATTCRKRVVTLSKEIDELIEARQKSIDSCSASASEVALLNKEGAVLADLRDCSVNEFKQLSVRSTKWRTGRNVSNLCTFGAASTGGYIGALCSLLAINDRNPRLAVPAGIGFICSGSIIALAPIASRVSASLAGKLKARTENKILGSGQNLNQLDADRERLASMVAELTSGSAGSSASGERLSIYNAQTELLKKQVSMGQSEQQASKREFKEKLLTSTIIGGTKIGYGTQLVLAGSGFSRAPSPKAPTIPVQVGNQTVRVPIPVAKTSAQMFSRRVAQAATTFIPGPAVGALDALQSRVRGQRKVNRAKKLMTSPEQVLQNRLKILAALEQKIK